MSAKLDIKSERGKFTVEVSESHFGDVIRHGLEANRVMLMGLPQHAGWRAITSICLPHQTYVKKVDSWLEDEPMAREIAVLNPDDGVWKTVWVRNGHTPIHE